MPHALGIPNGVWKSDGRWYRNCPKCKIKISHLRRNYCIHAHQNRQPCKRCSNISNHPSGMFGPVRVAWYNSFRKSAIARNLEWHLSIEDIATMYERQAGKCAMTGWDIGWSETGWDHTASLDRIDNSRGYDLGNIQIVHKTVNMARGSLSIVEFQKMCLAVADRVKW